MIIGAHISIAKGYTKAVEEAFKMNADTFQFFTRNPRGGKAKELDFKDIENAKKLMIDNNVVNLLAHAPYTMNLCSGKESVRKFAKEMMKDDLERMEYLPSKLYNFHPGSHTGIGVENAISIIIKVLNEVMFKDMTTTVLLETMAGKGTEIGRDFNELKKIIDGIEMKENIGICLDTCHIFSAGYDIVNDLDGVLNEFDKIVGLDKLKAIHLNDSLKPFNNNKDRHAKIGEGLIGLEAIVNIINHPRLEKLPFYLETPNDFEGYKKEIELLRTSIKNKE
jgi:deoxyribonuclease-4